MVSSYAHRGQDARSPDKMGGGIGFGGDTVSIPEEDPAFGHVLYSFMQGNVVAVSEYEHALLVFVAACGLFALLAVLLDWCYYLAYQKASVLGLNYAGLNIFLISGVWIVGAAIGGFFGQIFHVLQVTPLAAATAGMGWPVIFINLYREKVERPGNSQPAGDGVQSAKDTPNLAADPATQNSGKDQ